MPYAIRYAPDVEAHLRVLPRYEQAAVLDAVSRQLAHEPATETRNRKPMRPNPLAPWELRVGRVRVYYDVSEVEHTVQILAVGLKAGNRVLIGGEEFEL